MTSTTRPAAITIDTPLCPSHCSCAPAATPRLNPRTNPRNGVFAFSVEEGVGGEAREPNGAEEGASGEARESDGPGWQITPTGRYVHSRG